MKAKILKLSLLSFLILFALVIGFMVCYALMSYDYGLDKKALKLSQERQQMDEFDSFEKVKVEANELFYQDLRDSLNLPKSTKDEYLCKFTSERLEDVKKDWSHDKPKIFGYGKANRLKYASVSENLADGKQTKQRGLLTPMVEWVSSKPHFQAMINPKYTRYCMKCTTDKCVLLMAQPQNP